MEQLRAGDPRALGPYRVIARLGAGGMGLVFLCVTAGGRRLAVKVIRPELADDVVFRARFRQEVVAARLVRSHVTAAVIDADTESASPWLATAYLEGPTLLEAAARKPLGEEALRQLAASLAEALQCIHEVGLVHRDLKPSNIILTSDGPRVVDFGIARAVDATVLSATNARIGSPGYIAPEQIRGEPLSATADVFSLGAVLVYAATGGSPFGEGPVEAVLYRILHERPDLQGVPPGLRLLVGQCLADDPADRPTAQEVLERSGHPFVAATVAISNFGDSNTLVTTPSTTSLIISDFDAPQRNSKTVRREPPRQRRHGVLVLASFVAIAVGSAWATQHWLNPIPAPRQSVSATLTSPPSSRIATPTTSTSSTAAPPPKTASPSPAAAPIKAPGATKTSAPAQAAFGGYAPLFDPPSLDCKPRRQSDVAAQWQVSAPPYSVKEGDFVELSIRDKFGNFPNPVTYLQPFAVDVEVIPPDGSSQLAHTFTVSDREGKVVWPRDFDGVYPTYAPGIYTVIWTEAADSVNRTTSRPRFLACYGFTVDGPTDDGCSTTVKAGPKTSCAFALNVEAAWLAAERRQGFVEAFSPVTKKSYSMYCESGRPTVCSGGVDAVVYIYR